MLSSSNHPTHSNHPNQTYTQRDPPSLDQQGNPLGAGAARNHEDWRHDTFEGCLRPATAEFVASLLFMYIAAGAGASAGAFNSPAPAVLSIAIAFGFTAFILSWAIGHISGGHLNPLVTMVFMCYRKMSWLRGGMYLFAQAAGYMCGAGILRASTPDVWTAFDGSNVRNCLASTLVQNDMGVGRALLMEIMLAAFLLMVVCAATDTFKANQIMVPLAIGLTYTACLLAAVPATGGSLNPFRSFASASVSRTIGGCNDVWENHWVYWVGPIVGAFVGAAVYEFALFDGGVRTFGVPLPGDYTRYDLVKAYRLTPVYDVAIKPRADIGVVDNTHRGGVADNSHRVEMPVART